VKESPATVIETAAAKAPAIEAPAIEARGVGRTLPGPVPVTLVRDVDLTIATGSFCTIIGPSGSGKSSLLYLLGLLDRPTEGEILLDGTATGDLDEGDLARIRLTKLGFVFQFHFLLPEFTVLGNVMIPMRRLARIDEEARHARAAELLASLGLESEGAKRPDQLSGGQRQRVAVARALANDPAIVLADEPTGNLDTHNADIVFEIFAALAHEEGKTVVAVTHNAELAARADRRIEIVDGRITDSG
jgi:lipoprotein-releasing system ATP-binding protein